MLAEAFKSLSAILALIITLQIEPPLQSLGEYTITAYCSCEICCGEYAKNRPVAKDGHIIVYGAYGIELKEGISIASPLPYNTKITIDGLGEYIIQDTTSKWIAEKYDNKIIDIYFSNHEKAKKFGKKKLEIWITN